MSEIKDNGIILNSNTFDNGNSISNNPNSPIISKSLKSYYENREKRLAKQAIYDKNHKAKKKDANAKRWEIRKAQRKEEKQRQLLEEITQAEKIIYIEDKLGNKLIPRNINVLKQFAEREIRDEKISAEARNQKQRLEQIEQLEQDAFNHKHGAPRKQNRERYRQHRGLLSFHFKGEIMFFAENSHHGIREVKIEAEKRNYGISGKQYSNACCTYLGLTAGDSLVFKNEAGCKCQICFDGSGLDIADIDLYMQFMSIAAETRKKGVDLIKHFAANYSKEVYCRLYRGNKTFLKMGE